jgi:hypothetical protein
MANRFERVDEIAQDAITLALSRDQGGPAGAVICPQSALPGRLAHDFRSDKMGAEQALAQAIKLANDVKLAIVVMDPDNIWRDAWGELYLWMGDEDEENPSSGETGH